MEKHRHQQCGQKRQPHGRFFQKSESDDQYDAIQHETRDGYRDVQGIEGQQTNAGDTTFAKMVRHGKHIDAHREQKCSDCNQKNRTNNVLFQKSSPPLY
ncbi:hypothetical protein SDC9_176898 [bioreactor metagenome]|uniref:Uncharacterized protein n=1 Tax=bioreactor metagenome TaxID=1076179 RepID=A0A645GRS8_9ZZZZ